MTKFISLVFCVFLITSCKSVETHNIAVTKKHSIEEIKLDIDKLYKQLKRHHPRLYQFISKEKLDFKFDSLKQSIKAPMTSREFHKQLAQITKHIGQGHMSVSPPYKKFNRKERKKRNKMVFDINNIDTEYLDGKLFIRQARGKDSMLVNAEILSINNNNPEDLFEEYKRGVASDGYNTTFQPRVVGYRFLSYYKQANGVFDSINLKLKNKDSTFIKSFKRLPKALTKTPKDSISKDSLRKKQKPKKLSKAEKKAKRLASKKKLEERRKKSYDYLKKEYRRELTFIGKDSTVGYLKIKGFKGGKYKDFYNETFKRLDSLKTKTLIIDLRNNFGGSLKEINNLYSYLTDKKYTLINLSETNTRIPILKAGMSNTRNMFSKTILGILSPGILTQNLLRTKKVDGKLYYKFNASKEHEPNVLNFKGKLYVLINGNSFSASSVLSTQLKGVKRAIFVGEETGGAYNGTVAGYYKVYMLPKTKIKARIGLMHIDSKYKTTPDGYGIKPDIKIIPTYEDRLNGVDPEIEWVLNDIKSKNQGVN